jgi:hypothetical protein
MSIYFSLLNEIASNSNGPFSSFTPTTSLDLETIDGLADSLTEYVTVFRWCRETFRLTAILLTRLINERQRQNNFQLIVITHDEGKINLQHYPEVWAKRLHIRLFAKTGIQRHIRLLLVSLLLCCFIGYAIVT